jgi:hypothetical protein
MPVYCAHAECGAVIGVIFYRLLYIAVRSDRDFSPQLLFSSFDALTLSPLVLLSFDFFVILSDGKRVFSSS